MKYLVLINGNKLLYQDKIIFFDTEDGAKYFIDSCNMIGVGKLFNMEVCPIDSSKIDDKFINYEEVSIM